MAATAAASAKDVEDEEAPVVETKSSGLKVAANAISKADDASCRCCRKTVAELARVTDVILVRKAPGPLPEKAGGALGNWPSRLPLTALVKDAATVALMLPSALSRPLTVALSEKAMVATWKSVRLGKAVGRTEGLLEGLTEGCEEGCPVGEVGCVVG